MKLEFATTEELIQELLSRSTFAGIIIKASNEIRDNVTPITDWDVYMSSLYPHDTKFILEKVVSNIENEEHT